MGVNLRRVNRKKSRNTTNIGYKSQNEDIQNKKHNTIDEQHRHHRIQVLEKGYAFYFTEIKIDYGI